MLRREPTLWLQRVVPLLTLLHAIRGRPLVAVAGIENASPDTKDPRFVPFLIISVVLVLLGGVFAGLTLGLMGQDEVYLKVISTSGTAHEQKLARRVLGLISRGKHWLLVTLLLSNVITNETLPIVLDRCLGGGWQAVVSSTVLIVIFGEIIPQSICVRYGLEVGAFFCPFVLCLMYVLFPVAFPIALLLDRILGEDHGTMYKKSGLKTLVTLHRTMGVDRLTRDEVTIISAVLDLKEKRVSEIMTPIENVFTMSADTILNDATVDEIFNSGFSRIPIHFPGEPNNFIGMLLVRVLISYDPEDGLPVSHFPLATLPETSPDTSCLNILNYFQEGKSHMCVVSKEPGSSLGALGVLTLEDVIEELIGEEIVDESDVFVDIHQRIMREQPGPLAKRHITSYLHSLYTNSHRRSGANTSEERKPLLTSEPDGVVPNDVHSNGKNTPSSVRGKIVLPSNPASNPLHTHNPHVTVKRLPELSRGASPPKHRGGSPNYGGTDTFPKASQGSSNSLEKGMSLKDDKKAESIFHEHRDSAQVAADYTAATGEPTKVTTTRQSSPLVLDKVSSSNSAQSGLLPDTRMISSSYRSTKNGIVESVVTVKGVPKTIIEPAKNWDESQEVVIDERHNVRESGDDSDDSSRNHPSSGKNATSRRGSVFSILRRVGSSNSRSSSRHTPSVGSASSERIESEALGSDEDAYSMKNSLS
ncbi:LAMI_0G14906g1_1 [Lachancea mirantina]|uniref:LAMI_0G14906g1_1 n=1 Tax=Lachancea mirantina TaxID=1230905 RepID=A0A1G4KC80_9SACH|nr:LAMI_0G14906g1_1 [Lachancea mirantina]